MIDNMIKEIGTIIDHLGELGPTALYRIRKEIARCDNTRLSMASGVKENKNVPYTMVPENETNGELLIKLEPEIAAPVDVTFDYNKQETNLSNHMENPWKSLPEMHHILKIDHLYSTHDVFPNK